MVDAKTGRELSPYYPPQPKLFARIREVWEIERHNLGDTSAQAMPLPDPPLWQLSERFSARAVSRPGRVPHGYLTHHVARAACEAAGKRLCTEEEWVSACRGARDTKFPYGAHYVAGRCNVHRAIHPGAILHGNASLGLTDPRMNLVTEDDRDPLLRLTGATASCASRWGDEALFDMVGNLDEWLADPSGVFVGGFYARMTSRGCEAKITSHAPEYFDYSTGTRCCKTAS